MPHVLSKEILFMVGTGLGLLFFVINIISLGPTKMALHWLNPPSLDGAAEFSASLVVLNNIKKGSSPISYGKLIFGNFLGLMVCSGVGFTFGTALLLLIYTIIVGPVIAD